MYGLLINTNEIRRGILTEFQRAINDKINRNIHLLEDKIKNTLINLIFYHPIYQSLQNTQGILRANLGLPPNYSIDRFLDFLSNSIEIELKLSPTMRSSIAGLKMSMYIRCLSTETFDEIKESMPDVVSSQQRLFSPFRYYLENLTISGWYESESNSFENRFISRSKMSIQRKGGSTGVPGGYEFMTLIDEVCEELKNRIYPILDETFSEV